MRKGLSVLESGNRKGGAAGVDRLQMCLSDKLKEQGVCISSLAQSWLWGFIETASKPPHKPITKLYTLYARNSTSHTYSANLIWFQWHFPSRGA